MTEIFNYVADSKFCRIHKSYVVGLKHVQAFEVQQLIIGKYKIPVGTIYREDLLRRIKM